MKKTLLGIASIVILLSACEKEKVIFEKKYDLTNATWQHADTLNFAFDIADTTSLYDLSMTVSHKTDYGFQNIYTQIYTQFPSGLRSKQLLNLDLSDNMGKWNGTGSGNTRQFQVNIQQNAFFNQVGKHVITLEQFMRTDALVGIENITLKIIDKQIKRQ